MSEDELNDIEEISKQSAPLKSHKVAALIDEVRRLRAVIRHEVDGCWCDDRDGNCNPPHNDECERCKRLGEALR